MSRTTNPAGWPEGTCRTPAWLTRAILPKLAMHLSPEAARASGEYVLDLGCGDGAIAEVLAAAGYSVVGIDKRLESLARIPLQWIAQARPDHSRPGISTILGDALDPATIKQLLEQHGRPAAVVMNPPFLLGERKAFSRYQPHLDGVRQFIEVARGLTMPSAGPEGIVFALSRAAWWLEIEGRDVYRSELEAQCLVTMYSTSRRPGFYPDRPTKTDATAYCWLEIMHRRRSVRSPDPPRGEGRPARCGASGDPPPVRQRPPGPPRAAATWPEGAPVIETPDSAFRALPVTYWRALLVARRRYALARRRKQLLQVLAQRMAALGLPDGQGGGPA